MSTTPLGASPGSMTHAALTERVKQLSVEVRNDEAQHHQLAVAHRQAEQDLRQAEQHHIISNNEVTQAVLAEATDRLTAARERLRQHPAQGALKKVVLRQLGDELRARESELHAKARAACIERWKSSGTPADYAATARRVIAEAALADCHARTEGTSHIEINNFIATRLFPMEIQRLFVQLVDQEMVEAKKKIVAESNGRFGS